MSETLIRVENVSKVYGTGEASTTALDNVNLTVKRGSWLAVMGPSGHGKSTLLQIMGGLDRPTAGQIYLNGLELTALPRIGNRDWVDAVESADVMLVEGGDPLYLNYWMKQSGLAELLPALPNLVYVGLSAGSMVMAPRIGSDFVSWTPPNDDGDRTLGLVDFAIFPHLNHPALPDNNMAAAEGWAAELQFPCYAMDDDTAISVVHGEVEVVSEGDWYLFNH